jgi:hypothetical protein
VGLDRLGDHDDGLAAAPRPIDPGPHEGELETSDRGQSPVVCVLAELEPDQPSAAGWVVTFKIACNLEQLLDSRWNRATTRAIVRSQIVALASAKQPPDIPNRAIRDGQLSRDPGQGYALLTTAHNFLAERHRKRT